MDEGGAVVNTDTNVGTAVIEGVTGVYIYSSGGDTSGTVVNSGTIAGSGGDGVLLGGGPGIVAAPLPISWAAISRAAFTASIYWVA